MNDMQSQMWNAMFGAANSFAAACTAAMEANLSMQNEAMRAWSGDSDRKPEVEADKPSFTAFEFPEQGRSWYRAPFEHPVLAFWDQVMQPWRTYWPGASMFQSADQMSAFGLGPSWPTGLDATKVAHSYAPWMNYWANAFAAPQWAFQPASEPRAHSSELSTNAEPRPMPGFAIAKVRFADDTEVTMTVPLMSPFFAPAYLPSQGRSQSDK